MRVVAAGGWMDSDFGLSVLLLLPLLLLLLLLIVVLLAQTI
jgi:hypothetical protein